METIKLDSKVTKYVCIYGDGSLVAISGNNPYKTEYLENVEYWYNKEDATAFAMKFKDLTVVGVEWSLKVIAKAD